MLCAMDLGITDDGEGAGGEQAAQIAIALLADTAEPSLPPLEWEETTEFRTRANIRPITPLRRLLSQHQHICDRILDEQEIEVGLWA